MADELRVRVRVRTVRRRAALVAQRDRYLNGVEWSGGEESSRVDAEAEAEHCTTRKWTGRAPTPSERSRVSCTRTSHYSRTLSVAVVPALDCRRSDLK